MIYALVALVGYLFGSVPFGIIAGRFAGVDVREHGSGNIGATNVLRVLGKKFGYAVFVADALKGFAAVWFAVLIAHRCALNASLAGIIAAFCAIAGHSFPVWLKFSGGKGVATSAGAGFALVPWALLPVGIGWLLTFYLSQMVSLSSMVAALIFPLAVWLIYRDPILLLFGLLIAAVIVVRHQDNIRRILTGTEPRFRKE